MESITNIIFLFSHGANQAADEKVISIKWSYKCATFIVLSKEAVIQTTEKEQIISKKCVRVCRLLWWGQPQTVQLLLELKNLIWKIDRFAVFRTLHLKGSFPPRN